MTGAGENEAPGPVVNETAGPVVNETAGPVVNETAGPVVNETAGRVENETTAPVENEAAASSLLAERLDSLAGWPWRGRSLELHPMAGGLNNENWRLVVGGAEPGRIVPGSVEPGSTEPGSAEQYFLKVPGAGTDSFVDRDTAREASHAAGALGIGPTVAFHDPGTGIEATEFLDGYRHLTELELSTTDAAFDVVRAYKTFHGAAPLSLTRTFIDEIDASLDDLASHGWRVPDWAERAMSQWWRASRSLSASGIDTVPCHNDPNYTNMMVAPGKPFKLVDYEFAANNDPSYEVLGLISYYPIPAATKRELIEEYFGAWTPSLEARMHLMHLAILVRFSLWAIGNAYSLRTDYDYEKFGTSYLVMADGIIRHPDWETWLKAV
ncbi:choline/ethanolamine kinase family protein [Demequina sp. NBRC 110054]|uniref:choline/ethanolamine kinase family protein n=1 Tax=Demequina sp. NBRC 110054 TaxID=1570343 RepID=UPI0011780271|nr:choline/ethanolamine kinase family protein [Demequina sp. NBRC 110054]